MKQCCEKYGMAHRLSSEARNALVMYDWPGNVRELAHLIEQLVITISEDVIDVQHLPENMLHATEVASHHVAPESVVYPLALNELIAQTEAQIIRDAHQRFKSTYKMADMLQISQATAFRKVRQYVTDGDLNVAQSECIRET